MVATEAIQLVCNIVDDALDCTAAGAEVVNILMSGGVTERASVDEAYVDVTVRPRTHHTLTHFDGLHCGCCAAAADLRLHSNSVCAMFFIVAVVGTRR